MIKKRKAAALITACIITVFLSIAGIAFTIRSIQEKNLANRYTNSVRAFWLAEAGIQNALEVISNNPLQISDNDWLTTKANVNNNLGAGSFNILITTNPGDASIKNITSKGTAFSTTRQVQIQAQNKWLSKIPGAVYSNGGLKVKFDKRDDAYIDGHEVAGIYTTGEVKVKKEGEGKIYGNPPIKEASMPEGLQNGIWEVFNLEALRETAKTNGTYFQGDDYNKKGKKDKFTLPVVEGEAEGVFFFDTRGGVPFDDDALDKENEAKVELKGTTEQVSGVIVVVGDLKIVDTKDYDFLFDGVILVLDDLKIDDKGNHRRKKDGDTNDSDIVIRGAVLSDNVIEKGKKRKKKATVDIKNATIENDPGAISFASSLESASWDIVPNSWQEF